MVASRSKTLKRLVQKKPKGRNRFTDISIEENGDGTANIIKRSGVIGGVTTESTTRVKTGYTKALSRANTLWKNENKKITMILPMLANKWSERKHHISTPFYVQPKIDGVRLLVSNKGGISRVGTIIPETEIWGVGLQDGQYMDGECFLENTTFEEIVSLFKTDPLQLQFHVFDFFDVNKPGLKFTERMNMINVETIKVEHEKDFLNIHERFKKMGYEGSMIRGANSIYEPGKRSNYLLKHKDFQDQEYEIIGFNEGSGRDKGAVIWECKTGDTKFSVKPEGTRESRIDQFKRGESFIGKLLTVRYQNLTAYGVPRFPVGVSVRDYE
ncbi:unnamed protein product [Pylaiella littoralis]